MKTERTSARLLISRNHPASSDARAYLEIPRRSTYSFWEVQIDFDFTAFRETVNVPPQSGRESNLTMQRLLQTHCFLIAATGPFCCEAIRFRETAAGS